jgi:MFS family permease
MVMFSGLSSLWALLASVGILLAGNGLQNTLISVRGNLEGFSPETIGFFSSAYFVGFIVGCFVAPVVVRRVGHIRAFAVFAAVAATALACHAMFVSPPAWLALRAVSGVCFVGLFTVIESWISERSTNENRGQVFSVYRIISLAAVTAGQGLLTLADPASFELFVVVAMLITLALVPVALSTSPMPRPPKKVHIRLGRLYRVSPLGMVCSMIGGVVVSTVWAMGPLFVQSIGLSVGDVAVFVTMVIVGGAMAQWPIGKLSDMFDRRTVIIGTAAAGVATAAGLAYVGYAGLPGLFVAALLFGATAMPLYGLAVAHANDFAEPGEFVEISGGLILANAVGAVVGVPVAARLAGVFGEWAAFAFLSGALTVIVLFGLYRMTRRATVAPEDRSVYVGSPTAMAETKVATKLDPRSQTQSSGPRADER